MSKFRNPSHGRDHQAWGPDPAAGFWFDVETSLIDGEFDPTYTFKNSWVNVGEPYHPFQYRRGATGLEFQGHVTGGASGTVICTLLADHRPFKNISFLTDVGDIGSFVVGRIEIDAVTGDVTITFPAN